MGLLPTAHLGTCSCGSVSKETFFFIIIKIWLLAVFYSLSANANSTVKNQPSWSCELGWTSHTWDGHICADPCISSAGSVSKAWAVLFLWNPLIYCFILFIVTGPRAWFIHLLSKSSTFFFFTSCHLPSPTREGSAGKRRLGELTGSTYKASPQHAGARKGQGVNRGGISKGHQVLFCRCRPLFPEIRKLLLLSFL